MRSSLQSPNARRSARARPFGAARIASAAALMLIATTAHADDKEGAAALFTEAGRLVDTGNLAAACPKYEESLKLFDGLNTRYFLADCYERTGRVASAWSLYLEVATKAQAAGDEAKESKARERATAIAPRVSRLNVVVDDTRAAGLDLLRDGVPMPRAQWSVPVPIDPGPHAIDAKAAGKKPLHLDVTVATDGENSSVTLPPLESDPTAVATASPSDAARTGVGDGRRVVGLVVGATGVATLAVGTVLGFAAKSRFDEARSSCDGDLCDASGVEVRASAVRRANAATVVFGLGAAAVIGGAVLWFTAPRAQTLAVGATPTGLIVRGVF